VEPGEALTATTAGWTPHRDVPHANPDSGRLTVAGPFDLAVRRGRYEPGKVAGGCPTTSALKRSSGMSSGSTSTRWTRRWCVLSRPDRVHYREELCLDPWPCRRHHRFPGRAQRKSAALRVEGEGRGDPAQDQLRQTGTCRRGTKV